MSFFFMADDTILYLKQGMSSNATTGLQMEPISLLKLSKHLNKLGNDHHKVPLEHRQFQRHPWFAADSVKTIAYSGPLEEFGVIGFRKMTRSHRRFKSHFAKKHCCSLTFINNKELVKKNIFFRPWTAKEDLVFCNDADAKGLEILKFNLFEIYKVNVRSHFVNELYQWTGDENMVEEQHAQFSRVELVTKIKTYLNSLRIRSVVKQDIPEIAFEPKLCRKEGNGTLLYLLREFEQFQAILKRFKISGTIGSSKLENKTFVIPIDKIIHLKNMNGIKTWISKQGIKDFSLNILSVAKPVMLSDYVIIHIVPSKKVPLTPIKEMKPNLQITPSIVDSEGAGDARVSLEFGNSKKRTEREIVNQLLSLTPIKEINLENQVDAMPGPSNVTFAVTQKRKTESLVENLKRIKPDSERNPIAAPSVTITPVPLIREGSASPETQKRRKTSLVQNEKKINIESETEPIAGPSNVSRKIAVPLRRSKEHASTEKQNSYRTEKEVTPGTLDTKSEIKVQNTYFIKRKDGRFDQVKDDSLVLVNAKALAKICNEHPDIEIKDLFLPPKTQVSEETVKQIKNNEMELAGKNDWSSFLDHMPPKLN
jgi:hypothetical protein